MSSNIEQLPRTIREALLLGVTTLKAYREDKEAFLEAEILLADVLAKNRTYLFAYPEKNLYQEQVLQFIDYINQRAHGRPIAYITGKREFWSLTLKVNEHTLIPRHETELIVELTLQSLPAKECIHLLDLGTGSGAIALAIASERPHWRITACDKSKEALAVAEENANTLGITNLSFYRSDWFKELPTKHYHAIVANPPYIASTDPHLAFDDVCFEPKDALISGHNGFADLECIAKESLNYLKPGGLLLLEHGYDQKSTTTSILNELGYERVHCWQDLGGQDRVSGGWSPSK